MSDEIIAIHYCQDEVGPAQKLPGRLARVAKTPEVAPDFCRNAIVRLDRDPGEGKGLLWIAEVVYNPFPRRTFLSFNDPGQGQLLVKLFASLGADAEVVFNPREGCSIVAVSHAEGLDPVALANALGIAQAPAPTVEEGDD
jgi:hypothetical protein